MDSFPEIGKESLMFYIEHIQRILINKTGRLYLNNINFKNYEFLIKKCKEKLTLVKSEYMAGLKHDHISYSFTFTEKYIKDIFKKYAS